VPLGSVSTACAAIRRAATVPRPTARPAARA
jgi:hypothetical protein